MRLKILIATTWLILTAIRATAQDWAVADSLVATSADTTDYGARIQPDFNALRYSLDGQHQYTGDTLGRRLSFFEIGGGRMAVNDNRAYMPVPFYLVHARLGRQLSELSSVRFGISGGVGFIRQNSDAAYYNSTNARGSLQADYLYSLSTHLMGYRPERLLDVSGFIGAGVGFSTLFKSNREEWIEQLNTRRVTAMVRSGLQLKFFAGPQAALALEPYVYMSTKGIDLVRPEHEYYSYRMGYGLDVTFIQYLGNRLSAEDQAGTFRKVFSRRQRYFAADVPAILLSHPIIAAIQTGAAGVGGDGRSFYTSAGVGQAAYLGWWMSPAIGIRGQIGTDNMKWSENGDKSLMKMVAYRHGALDLMINPFGFGRHYNWQTPVGITLMAGYEGGYAFRESTSTNGFPAFGYRGSLSLWARLANGLRMTVEPQYTILIHKNDASRAATDYLTRVKVGLEMFIGGERETADTVNKSTPFPRGYYIGAGAGRNFTPRFYQEGSREREWLKSGLFFAGYDYTDLHGIRLSGEYMSDIFQQQGTRQRQERWIAAVGYRLSLSNWLRGINPHRRWNLSMNMGPALAIGDGSATFGANVGLELSYRLGKHFSLFLAQNLYWIPGGLYDTDQTTDANLNNTFNIGLIYHFERLVQPTIQLAQTTAHAIGTAGAVTGRAIGNATMATGRAIGTAGIATGRAIGAAGIATGKAIGSASVTTGKAIGIAGITTGKAVGRLATNMFNQQGHPFFVEYALGYQHILHMPTDGIDTWEPELQMGIGWWALPAIGLRIGGDLFRGSSKESAIETEGATYTRYDKLRLSYICADLLMNPLGLLPHYDWQSVAGVNLICGHTLLNLAHHNIEERYWRHGPRLGAQLWTRVDDCLRLHVEPMFTLINCNPQSDNTDDYTSKEHRDIFSLKVGLTLLLQSDRLHQHRESTGLTAGNTSLRPRWFIGGGGGLHFNKDDYRLGGGGTNSNLQLLLGRRFGRATALRIGEELTFDHFIDPCSYTPTTGPEAGHQKRGMGITTFRYLFSSIAAQYDLMTLFADTPSRKWDFCLVGGFALSSYLSETTTVPDETERYVVNYPYRISPLNGNVLLGFTFSYQLSKRFSAYFNHHAYIYSLGMPRWVHYSPQIWSMSGLINTFNAGLMYSF